MAELANSKKILESRLAEYTAKITEITNINTSLASIKVKLEKDLTQVSASYEDMAKELKLADDRANKAAHDAQHFEGLLRYFLFSLTCFSGTITVMYRHIVYRFSAL